MRFKKDSAGAAAAASNSEANGTFKPRRQTLKLNNTARLFLAITILALAEIDLVVMGYLLYERVTKFTPFVESDLLGTWECGRTIPPPPVILRITFLPGGKFSEWVQVAGIPDHFSEGTWTIDDDKVDLDHMWVQEPEWIYENATWRKGPPKRGSAFNFTLRGSIDTDPDDDTDIVFIGRN